jgi:hypothetical protein
MIVAFTRVAGLSTGMPTVPRVIRVISIKERRPASISQRRQGYEESCTRIACCCSVGQSPGSWTSGFGAWGCSAARRCRARKMGCQRPRKADRKVPAIRLAGPITAFPEFLAQSWCGRFSRRQVLDSASPKAAKALWTRLAAILAGGPGLKTRSKAALFGSRGDRSAPWSPVQ